jgi:hypothetical protein
MLILMALMMLAACAGRESKPDAPAESAAAKPEAAAVKDEPLLAKRYRAIAVDEFTAAADPARDYPEAARECQAGTVQALKDKKAFQSVESGKYGPARREGTLWVRARVADMRIVSGAARMWGGVFAGSSHMEVEIALVDAATGTTVREKKLSSANNPWAASYAWGSSDRSLPVDMGGIIAEYVAAVVPK